MVAGLGLPEFISRSRTKTAKKEKKVRGVKQAQSARSAQLLNLAYIRRANRGAARKTSTLSVESV